MLILAARESSELVRTFIVVIIVTRDTVQVQDPSCGRADPGGELELVEEEEEEEEEVGCLVLEEVGEAGPRAGVEQGEGLELFQVRRLSRLCLTPVSTGLLWPSSG